MGICVSFIVMYKTFRVCEPHMVSVRFRDAAHAGRILDALVAAGAKYSAVFDMLANPTEVSITRGS